MVTLKHAQREITGRKVFLHMSHLAVISIMRYVFSKAFIQRHLKQ